MFGLLGGAAAAGTGLAVAGSALAPAPAGAAVSFDLSTTNDGGALPTEIHSSASPAPTLDVLATGTGGGGAIRAHQTNAGYAAHLVTANSAQIRLENIGTGIGPPLGFWDAGALCCDSAGVLWYHPVSGSVPADWVSLSGGALKTLPAPFRVYDSRTGQPNPSGSPQGTLAFGAPARTINCSPAVPTGSTILFNLTATGTAGPSAGALLVWAVGAMQPVASSINWSSAGLTVANSVTSACDPATQDVQVRCVASTGSSTDFILDVVGYYL
jgi:hypothetical protein